MPRRTRASALTRRRSPVRSGRARFFFRDESNHAWTLQRETPRRYRRYVPPPSVITVRGRRTAFASAARRASRLRKSASKPALAVSGDPTARGTISRVAGDDDGAIKRRRRGAVSTPPRSASRPRGLRPERPPVFPVRLHGVRRPEPRGGHGQWLRGGGHLLERREPAEPREVVPHTSSAFPSGGAPPRPSADADADALDSPGLRGDSEETPRTSLPSLRFRAEDFVGDAKEVLGSPCEFLRRIARASTSYSAWSRRRRASSRRQLRRPAAQPRPSARTGFRRLPRAAHVSLEHDFSQRIRERA